MSGAALLSQRTQAVVPARPGSMLSARRGIHSAASSGAQVRAPVKGFSGWAAREAKPGTPCAPPGYSVTIPAERT